MSDENKKDGDVLKDPALPVIEVIPGETKKRRRRNTAWDKLTTKNQVFANEILSGTPATKAIQKLGVYPNDDKRAEKRAYQLVQNPKVQMALQERLNEMYPNLSKQMAQKIKFLMDQPIKMEKDQPGISVGEFLKLGEYLARIQGWEAPKKSAHLRGIATFKFPGESD